VDRAAVTCEAWDGVFGVEFQWPGKSGHHVEWVHIPAAWPSNQRQRLAV